MEIENVVERSFIKVYSDMKLGEIIETAVVKSKRNIYPVVNRKNDKLEGIILLDDLRPIMFNQSLYNEVTARELMQNPPTIINFEKDRMTSVMKKFQDTGAWNLPVESKGVYYGFVSKSRLLTAYRRKLIDFSRS